jgi:hypothetical protein
MGRRAFLILLILLLATVPFVGCGGAKKQLAGKAGELMNINATEKLTSGTRIQGKVAVVETYPGMSPSLEGFKEDGSIDSLSAYFFSPRRKAQSVDEIDTLVKVICTKGKAIMFSSPMLYANECDVSLIDFKTKTVFAKKRFENNSDLNGVSPNVKDVVASPSDQIKAYLREFSSYD